MKILKRLILLVLVLVCAATSFAQVNGTGGIAVLVANTPTPATPTPGTPTPGTPTPTGPTPTPGICGNQGGTCFSIAQGCQLGAPGTPNGCTYNQVPYGAGGTPIPNLSSPTIAQCTNNSGSDPGVLQSAINSGHDVLIEGSECNLGTTTVSMHSSQNVQCKNSSTILFWANTKGQKGTSMFDYDGNSNATFTNCTFKGAGGTAPPTYPGSNANGAFSFLIGNVSGSGPLNNVSIYDNVFQQGEDQAEVELTGVTQSSSSPLVLNWNSFYWCGGDAWTFDSVTNSEQNHNYLFDCNMSNELDTSADTLEGVVVNYNLVNRDQYGTGIGYQDEGGLCSSSIFAFVNNIAENDGGGSFTTSNASGTGNLFYFDNCPGAVFVGSNSAENQYGVPIAPNYVWGTVTNGCGNGQGPPYNGATCSSYGFTMGAPPNPGPSGP
jgi:hypothetical protein